VVPWLLIELIKRVELTELVEPVLAELVLVELAWFVALGSLSTAF
jgi:hypothetical protein